MRTQIAYQIQSQCLHLGMTIDTSSEYFNLPSPVDKHFFSPGGVKRSLYIKRDDLIHPIVSGNKWRKLRYNIDYLLEQGMEGFVTCGGPWSNHLIASAACAHKYGISAIGLVRGNYHKYQGYVLRECAKLGMDLHLLSNSEFDRLLAEPGELLREYGFADKLWIPLGGSNELGRLGCQEIVKEVIASGLKPDLWCVPAGTATTAAGMLEAIDYDCDMFVFPAIGKDKQEDEINQLFEIDSTVELHILDCHRLRFGKTDHALVEFLDNIRLETGILFDPIYNGKMLESLLTNHHDMFTKFNTPLLVHTGGLTGWKGIQRKY